MAPTPLIHQIALAICSVHYGAVNVTIHDGRIVQIETIEKIRVSEPADLSSGSSPHHWPTDRISGGSRLVNGY